MTKQPGEWNDSSPRRRPARSVWGRLGPWPGAVHERLGARVPLGQQGGNGFLQILKSKAVGRCYNCLARDHRIASCRDPPKCILCSRSGHKARRCPGRAPSAVWRRRAPAIDVSASAVRSAFASPSPVTEFGPGEAWRRPEPEESFMVSRYSPFDQCKSDPMMDEAEMVMVPMSVEAGLQAQAHARQTRQVAASSSVLHASSDACTLASLQDAVMEEEAVQGIDPMEEEAVQGMRLRQDQSTRLQCSVEPTVAIVGSGPLPDVSPLPCHELEAPTDLCGPASDPQAVEVQDQEAQVQNVKDSQGLEVQVAAATQGVPLRPLVDLENDERALLPDQAEEQENCSPNIEANVLGARNTNVAAVQKSSMRGINRLAVPLRKSLLCTPPVRPKSVNTKKVPSTAAADRKDFRQAMRSAAVVSIEDQAVALLMRSSGVLGEKEALDACAKDKFSGQFVQPLKSQIVGGMRNVLGLPEDGGADQLSALLLDDDA